jgi:hypothetical protein
MTLTFSDLRRDLIGRRLPASGQLQDAACDQQSAAGQQTCRPACVLASPLFVRIAPTVDGRGGGYGHASWRPSGPGPVGALAVTFCAVTDTADLVDITLNGQPYHPLAVRYPDQGLRRPQDRHQEFVSQTAPAAVQKRQGTVSRQLWHRPQPDHPAPPRWPQQEAVTCQILPTRAGSKRCHLPAAVERPTGSCVTYRRSAYYARSRRDVADTRKQCVTAGVGVRPSADAVAGRDGRLGPDRPH